MSSVPRVCSACGAASTWDARFCQQCGRPLREDEATPRYYGVLSPGPAFGLAGVLLIASLIALISGSVLAAVLLLAFAAVAFLFFYGAALRNPGDPTARRVFASGHHLRGWARFARTSISAWARAGRDVARLRGESRSLRSQREPTLRSLGEAAYREDEPRVQELRERLREIDDELARREQARTEALAVARRHVDEEREVAQPTQRLSVDDIESAGDPEK